MNVTREEIKNIFKKLDEELHELQYSNNTNTLIQISSDFKDIKEVIQYFEASMDTAKTQNEGLKETIKETIREMLIIQEKMLDGIIPRAELREELNKISKRLEVVQPKSAFTKFKEKLDTMITPKILIIAIAGIIAVTLFAFKPDFTKEFLHEFKPVIKVGK